jgi:transcriptional regulator with XRE-family HTH domain
MTTKQEKQDPRKKLGAWIKTKRLAAGLSQIQLAGLIGRSAGFIASMESGKRLDLERYLEMTKAVNVDPHQGITLIQRCLS